MFEEPTLMANYSSGDIDPEILHHFEHSLLSP